MRINGHSQSMDRDQTSKGARDNVSRVVPDGIHQHAQTKTTGVLRRALAENSRTGLAFRHLRSLEFLSISFGASTFLRALRSIPITGLHCYYGRSDSCSVGSSVAWTQHEHRLCTEQVSL